MRKTAAVLRYAALRVRIMWISESDVVQNRAVKEKIVLQNDAEMRAIVTKPDMRRLRDKIYGPKVG